MTVDLRLLDDWIDDDGWPDMPCPACEHGTLNVELIKTVESMKSQIAQVHPDWDPDWIDGGFHGSLRCQAKGCREPMTIAGDYRVGYSDTTYEANQRGAGAQYRLRYARPAFMLLRAPVKAPQDVVDAVAVAAKSLWLDPSASANGLRRSVELLLTRYKIRQVYIYKHKRKSYTTHRRIEMLHRKAS